MTTSRALPELLAPAGSPAALDAACTHISIDALVIDWESHTVAITDPIDYVYTDECIKEWYYSPKGCQKVIQTIF